MVRGLWRHEGRALPGPSPLAVDKRNETPIIKILLQERFDLLRLPMVYVRGYLTAYVQAIGLSVEAVVPAYMKKVQDWQSLHNR